MPTTCPVVYMWCHPAANRGRNAWEPLLGSANLSATSRSSPWFPQVMKGIDKVCFTLKSPMCCTTYQVFSLKIQWCLRSKGVGNKREKRGVACNHSGSSKLKRTNKNWWPEVITENWSQKSCGGYYVGMKFIETWCKVPRKHVAKCCCQTNTLSPTFKLFKTWKLGLYYMTKNDWNCQAPKLEINTKAD